MKIKFFRILSLALILIAFTTMAFAKGGGDKKSTRLNKGLGVPVYTKININNISTWIKNDGETDINQNGNSGFVFPKGSNKTAVFQSGFLWGGKVDGQWRVGGSTYRQGTVPGRILPNGQPANPDDPDVRIYRVRRDYKEGNLDAELADGDGPSIEAIREQYEKDWNEWPADQGAPYEDVDGDGKYDPTVDIPGVPGADQTVWFVCNDLDPAQTDYMYGSLPMGIEEQVTVWGYKATGALGNMIFRKFLIINKNPDKKPFTEMYVSMWSDIDLGDAGDDFAGCDTTLSLGYCYNANETDATYNPLPPPAVGFDYFQGPLIEGTPTDTAIFKGKYVPGKKNMPMTAFYFFINGDPIYSDPDLGLYETGALQWYNLFRGRISTSGDPFVDPTTSQPTKFTLSGDPIAATGWLDGQLHPPGDRRIGMASGPFEMAYGDTQEVVVAEIAAGAIPGVDRLKAVQLLKDYDIAAQIAYDRLFQLPRAPEQPKVVVGELDREIVLSWGSDIATVNKTESYSDFGYNFEGYNVYQLPSPSAQLSQAVRIATFDVVNDIKKITDLEFDPSAGIPIEKVVAFGNDSGIKRFISIKNDALKGGLPLNNGSRYYFAITAYAYNPNPPFGPKVLENALQILTVVPQGPKPGVRYESTVGKEIVGTRTKGKSDGKVMGYVVDPTKTKGGSYVIKFKDDGQGHGGVLWSVVKNGTVLVDNQSNLSGDENYPIVDGILIKVMGPPPGVKHDDMFTTDDVTKWGWDIPSGTRRFTWAGGADGFHFEGFQGALGWYSPRAAFGDGQMLVGPGEVKNVLLKLASVNFTGDYDPPFNPDDPNVSYGYRYLRNAQRPPAKEEFTKYILNPESYGFQEFAKNVPLSAWDIDDPANPKRLAVGFLENNVADGLVDGKYWPGNYNNYDNTATTGPREWLFIFDEPYTETPDPKLATNIIDSDARVMYWFTAARRGAVPFSPDETGNDQFAIYPNKAITPADEFQLTAPSVTESTELAKEDVEMINVFPNPYYGVNPQEINKYQRFVTFTHLPQKATIRIFNLAGQLVRTIRKDSPEQFQRWDLNNESSLPVASGIYIVHVDMPDLGKTKILKVAIIQEQQVLDRF